MTVSEHDTEHDVRYPPLTAAELTGHDDGRVHLVEIGDGDWVVAHGHVPPQEFAAALGEQLDSDYDSGGEHRWAVTVAPAPDWVITFGPDITADTPGAFPVTVAG